MVPVGLGYAPAMHRLTVSLLALFSCAGCASSLDEMIGAGGDDTLAVISYLADHRAGTNKLLGLLGNADPNVRRQAALALGRNEDKRALDGLEAALTDADPLVVRAAGFALSQLGGPDAELALLRRLKPEAEKHPATRIALWQAVGRVGSAATMAAIPKATGQDRSVALVQAGIILKRLGQTGDGLPWLTAALTDDDPEVRAAALYAYFRTGKPTEEARAAAARGITSESATERETSARVLSRGVDGVLAVVVDVLVGGVVSQPHRRAQLASGLARTAGPRATAALVAALQVEASKTFADALLTPAYHTVRALTRGLIGRTVTPAEKRSLAKVRMLYERPMRTLIQKRQDEILCDIALVERPRLPGKACSSERLVEFFPGLGYQKKATLTMRMAALNAMPGRLEKNPEDRPRATQVVVAALGHDDLPVAATAALTAMHAKMEHPAVGKAILLLWPRALRAQNWEVAGDVLTVLKKLKVDGAEVVFKEALASGQLAIARLGQEGLRKPDGLAPEIPPTTLPAFSASDVRGFAPPKSGLKAQVETDLGRFTMRLLPEVAPMTVKNFVTLANDGFFNGLTFHRVVENFVIQGGDPRGDGWGGPGYSIRCENNAEQYTTGTVGMALAGKDTAGSQWFVTHSAHPHLMGTYPVFARVIEGQGVVDAIMAGDIIRKITIVD